MANKFSYEWTLKDAVFTKDKGKVFSCFSCGGGSSMGYKLAGFDVVGCNEIDPRMMNMYIQNHHPKYSFLEGIQTFKQREDLPEELYNLDILDGSPPCSTFSISGQREDAWGKMKKFREGQAEQILDTLFFDFIDLAEKLQPKVVIAENVKGLIQGSARDYVRRIYQGFEDAGYVCQHFLLNASKMGVPQERERVFFICVRRDLMVNLKTRKTLFDEYPILDMDFNEEPILFKEIADGLGDEVKSYKMRTCWDSKKEDDKCIADANIRVFGKGSMFNNTYVFLDKVCPTVTAHKDSLIRYDIPNYLSQSEVCKASTFPLDYDFMGRIPHYVCGMSVPPVMMANIATRIYEQILQSI